MEEVKVFTQVTVVCAFTLLPHKKKKKNKYKWELLFVTSSL